MRINSFFQQLKARNSLLYYFTFTNLFGAILCLFLIQINQNQFLGISAWVKPLKFFISTAIFCATMGWITFYLSDKKKVNRYTWVVIIVFLFENCYIFIQAMRGEKSHFNISTPFNSIMFILMGVAISIMTVWTGVIGFLFWKNSFPDLANNYVWGIRLGILFFVVFAFLGQIMAAMLKHTVGGPDGGPGLPFVNWSLEHGDLRIAHFFGMHSLQILPIAGFYFSKNKRSIFLISIIYLIFLLLLFIQAMMSKPLIGWF